MVASSSEKRLAYGFPVWGSGIVSPGEEHFLFSISIVLKIVCWGYSSSESKEGAFLLAGVSWGEFVSSILSGNLRVGRRFVNVGPPYSEKSGHARFPNLVAGTVAERERRLHFHGRISKIPRQERVFLGPCTDTILRLSPLSQISARFHRRIK